MKKIIALLLALTFPVSISASIEDVQKYIESHYTHPEAFTVKEYQSFNEKYDHKTLLIEVSIAERYGNDDFVSTMQDVATDIRNQDWFDYEIITFLHSYSDYSPVMFLQTTFDVKFGTKKSYNHITSSPWIIKEKSDIADDDVNFIFDVVGELLRAGDVHRSPDFRNDDMDSMSIQAWSDFVVAEGTIHAGDGKEYSYLMEFTYKKEKDSQNGTYDAKYIEINGLTLYGEYVDIKDYKKTV